MKQRLKQPPKVVELLRQLTPEERASLMDRLSVSRATLWRMTNDPGGIGIRHAEAIRSFLQDAMGQPFTLTELWGLSGRLFTKPRKRALVA